MWQELIVGTIVLAAIIFLIRRWLPFFKSESSCGTACNGCGPSSPKNSCKLPIQK